MAVHWPVVFTLVNSIVGVSVLAYPFCFHECGIILAPLAMLASAWLTKKSCLLLLTAAQLSRRSSYESLAKHAYGAVGKLAVEASIIGLCFGSLCAFNVIIGDLAPSIVSNILGVQNEEKMRPVVMVLLTLGIGLPLSLMRNISSLAAISAMSLVFYTCFVSQVILAALPNLIEGSWINHINFWRPAGFLKCLPIFSLSFACQTVLFVLYDSLPDPSVKKMEEVVNTGINITSFVYISVGCMCYITYYSVGVKGDVLTNYGHSFIAETLKTGFVMSVIVSIPLMAFPMRASLNSLIFPSQTAGTENMPGGPGYMPQNRFVYITVSIIAITLIIGILIPQIEFVLGLTGATMGTLIAFIFPSAMFLMTVSDTQNNLRIVARILLFVGLFCATFSTYSVLTAAPSSHHEGSVDAKSLHIDPTSIGKAAAHLSSKANGSLLDAAPLKSGLLDKKFKENVDKINAKVKPLVADEDVAKGVKAGPLQKQEEVKGSDDKRLEPAIPHAPGEKGAKIVNEKIADPVNEKRQLMSTEDLSITKNKEPVLKPAANYKVDKPAVKPADQGSKPADQGSKPAIPDSKVEVSEDEINEEIAKLKEKKAEVDADIKNLEDLKDDKSSDEPKQDSNKADSRGKRDLEEEKKTEEKEPEKFKEKGDKLKAKPTEGAPAGEETPSAVVVTPGKDINTPEHPSPPPSATTPKDPTTILESSSVANDTGRRGRDLKSSDAAERKNTQDGSKVADKGRASVKKRRDVYVNGPFVRSVWGKMSGKLLKRRGLRTKAGRKIEVR